MTKLALMLPLLASTALACMHGPAHHETSPATTPPPGTGSPGQMSGMGGMCPTDVPGTQLSASDTSTGEELTFTTTPDQVTTLQERVRAMADMHNQNHASGGGGMHHANGGGMMHGQEMHGEMSGMMMPPPSRATVEDVENGARIVVTPNDPADLSKLQSTIRMHAQHMRERGCEMHGAPEHH